MEIFSLPFLRRALNSLGMCKTFFRSVVVLSSMAVGLLVSCEQHSWEDSKKFHEEHGPGHHGDHGEHGDHGDKH